MAKKTRTKAKSRVKKSPPKGPSFTQLWRAAKGLLPLVEAEAGKSERAFHMTNKLMTELRQSGLCALLTPKALGGSELTYVEAMKIVELVSHADGSAGWCLMVHGVQGAMAGAFLPDSGARAVYPKGADSIVAGHGVPHGFAIPVKGGFLINGNWGYGSTIHHAEWIHSGCFISDDGKTMRLDADGHPTVVLCHHPRDTVKLMGNWDVLGLRGTGSYDYTTKKSELFVPESMCFWFDDPDQLRGGTQYADGLPVTTTWGHTGWALGVGRRALDELAQIARERADAFGKMHDSASFLKSFAEAEATYRAARAFVYASWEDLSASYAKGKTASAEQVALIRLAMRHIHDVISEVSTFTHRTSRGISLRDSVLQRCYRDIHSGTQHIFLADQISQDCAKVLVGAAGKKAHWNVLGLIDS